MHICFVGLEALSVLLPGYENHRTGGEQVQISLLAKALVQRGFVVSVIVLDYGQDDEVIYEGIKIIKCYSPSSGFPIIRFIYPKIFKLWQALTKANADVYYTSCAGFPVGLIAYFCKYKKRKCVFRIASDKDCYPEQIGTHLLNRDLKLYEYGLRNQDQILVQSVQQQQALEKNYHLKSQIAQMLVDRPEKVLSFENRDIDILWVNNFRQLKRPDLMLEVASILSEFNIHMIGGPNDPDLYANIEKKAGHLDNVTFHGPIPYRLMDSFYSRAKILINTSDIEGFPNSYLQAWIRGTPIIVFFDPDNVISKNQLGYKAKDVADMANLIKKLLSTKDTWLQLSATDQAYMLKNYSEDSILQPYINAFTSLH